jgi:hypothetical protein
MSLLSFGPNLGPIKVVGMKAAGHCAVMIDGVPVGFIYKDSSGKQHYEYRGEAIGGYGLTWVAATDKRDVVNRLEESLTEAARLKRQQSELL